ncbi:MAG: PQQ-binding-like beta-propeller repeat protein [Pirellulaceae bacterium]|nr:PQQ-binding-like beta-propeller repeat protein [Pirellulaceae bacterium]
MLRLIRRLATFLRARRLQLAYAPARRIGLWFTVGLIVSFMVQPTFAQLGENQVRTMGLDVMWRSQLQMPAEAGSIVSTHLWTNPKVKKSYAELKLPAGMGVGSRTLRASADTLGKDGAPIGIEAAKKDVETRAARMLGRASGLAAVEVTVPMIYFVVVTSDGVVQNFDAETGESLWKNSCGSLRFPAAPASVSDYGIVVAHGPELYLLDWKTGKHLARRAMQRASTAGVAMIDNFAFVSSLSGQLNAFDFSKPGNASPWTYRLFGRAVTIPANSDRTHKLVAFATEDGVATLFYAGEKIGPWFNFEARSPLSGPLTFIGGAMYCGDSAGQISKVGLDRVGSVQWRFMLGSGLGAPPMVINKVFYATSEIGYMSAADDSNGFPLWREPVPRIRAILSGTQDHLYCRSLTNRLIVVDSKSGKIISQTGESLIATSVINHLTDRLYVISAGGTVQCLREIGKEHDMPTFLEPLPAPAESAKPAEATAPAEGEADPAMQEAPAESSDPFGASTAADPFAAPAAPADGAGAADPFAVPATPAGANPF